MSNALASAPAETPAPTPNRPVYRVTFRRVVRSEWSKVWSLRSTWITLGLSLATLVLFGLLGALRYKSALDAPSPHDREVLHSTALSLSEFGTRIAQLTFGVLGVLITAGEYTTGLIRSTFAAVPKRLPVLWAKCGVYGVVALAAAAVGAFGSFLLVSSLLTGTPAALPLSQDGVLRSLANTGLYLALIGVMGAALGSLLRSVAGGISVLVGSLLILPGLVSLLPTSWSSIDEYLPSSAADSMLALTQQPNTLSPLAGLAVLAGWVVVALAGAAIRLVRSDV